MCSSMLPGRARGAVERHARGLCFAAHGASNKRGLNRRSIVLAQGGAVKQQADATFEADAWRVEVRLAALARSDQKAQERANSTPVGKRRPWWWRRWPDERRRPRIPVKMPTRLPPSTANLSGEPTGGPHAFGAAEGRRPVRPRRRPSAAVRAAVLPFLAHLDRRFYVIDFRHNCIVAKDVAFRALGRKLGALRF
jgi:hypothetical protein